jgi:hypothetical protein
MRYRKAGGSRFRVEILEDRLAPVSLGGGHARVLVESIATDLGASVKLSPGSMILVSPGPITPPSPVFTFARAPSFGLLNAAVSPGPIITD